MTESEKNPFLLQAGRIKHGRLDNSYRHSWLEDGLVAGKNSGEVIGRNFDFSLLGKLFWFFGLLLSLLLFRLFWLQLIEGDYYFKMAEGNRIREERLEARRGIIYDRNLVPLVHNAANFLLYLLPADLPKEEAAKEEVFTRIAEIITPLSPRQKILNGQTLATSSPHAIGQAISREVAKINLKSLKAFEPLFIADNIPYEKALLLELGLAEMQGVRLSNKIKRDYRLIGSSLAHILGYTGKISEKELEKAPEEYQPIDYIGKNGLEYFYENELRGKNGEKQVEVDAMSKVKKVLNSEPAFDGSNLVLTIDVEVQKKLEELLSKQLKTLGLKRASAITLNPRNGEVLALVSLPAYDNNLFAGGITDEEFQGLLKDSDRPLFNRAIGGEFPCGSTIKPVMAAAALNEGVVSENTRFLSSGGLRIGQWFYPDWKAGGHGQTDVKKALAESVNTYFYIIGGGYEDFHGLGLERIVRYDKLFGLGEQTGIDLPGEADGFVPTREWKETTKKEGWYVGDTYHLSIGQGDLTTTPLQVAQFTAYFAAEGKIYQPHLVKKIDNQATAIEKTTETILNKEKLISADALRIVRQGMRQVITSGSARSIEASVPVAVAGKTGTAQWSSKKDPQAWFTGFAPYEEAEIVITILIEEGKEGSTAAVPVAREFLAWYFSDKKASSTSTN